MKAKTALRRALRLLSIAYLCCLSSVFPPFVFPLELLEIHIRTVIGDRQMWNQGVAWRHFGQIIRQVGRLLRRGGGDRGDSVTVGSTFTTPHLSHPSVGRGRERRGRAVIAVTLHSGGCFGQYLSGGTHLNTLLSGSPVFERNGREMGQGRCEVGSGRQREWYRLPGERCTLYRCVA